MQNESHRHSTLAELLVLSAQYWTKYNISLSVCQPVSKSVNLSVYKKSSTLYAGRSLPFSLLNRQEMWSFFFVEIPDCYNLQIYYGIAPVKKA